MRRIITGGVAATLLCFAFFNPPAIAADQAPKETALELSSVLAEALQNGPEAALPAARRLQGEAEAFGAADLPELEIEGLSTIKKGSGSRESEIEVIQRLRPSDFGSRKALAKSLRSLAGNEARAKELDLIHRVTLLYDEAWALQEKEGVFARNLKSAKKTEATLRAALAEGRSDRAEVDLFSAERLRLDEQIRQVSAARRERIAEVARLAGLQSGAEYRLAPPDTARLPEDFDVVLKLAERPEGLRPLYQARIDAARRQLDVARQDSVIGSWGPRLSVSHDYDSGGTAVSAGVVLSLPVWGRNRSAVVAAQAVRMEAESGLKALSGGNFEAVLRQSHLKARQASKSAATYRERILPAYRSVHDLALKRFQSGQSSVLEVWTVRERLTEVEEEAIMAVTTAVEARLALETLLGNTTESIQ